GPAETLGSRTGGSGRTANPMHTASPHHTAARIRARRAVASVTTAETHAAAGTPNDHSVARIAMPTAVRASARSSARRSQPTVPAATAAAGSTNSSLVHTSPRSFVRTKTGPTT